MFAAKMFLTKNSVQNMLVEIDGLQNRIKDNLKSEETRNLEMAKERTDSMKRIGKEISRVIKDIISDIGFNETNGDEGQGSTDNSSVTVVSRNTVREFLL